MFKVLGVNDDRNFCECCGKQNLARVVWIENEETGEIKHFGTTCAAKPAKGFGVDKEIKAAIAAHDGRRQFWLRIAHREYRKAGGTYTGNGADGWTVDDRALFNQILAEVRAKHPVDKF